MTPIIWLGLLALIAFWIGARRIQSTRRISELRTRNALVVDVRSPSEFQRGHAEGSINLPLDQIPRMATTLDPARPILLCCASGARSAAAAGMLKAKGFEVFNAGSWLRLRSSTPSPKG